MLATCVALALVGTVAFQSNTAAPAKAAAAYSCNGSGCNNKDPYQYNCTYDAYVVTTVSNGGGWLKLWYSPACVTNWLQAHAYSGYSIARFYMEDCPSNVFDQYGNCNPGYYDPNKVDYCEGSNSAMCVYGQATYSFTDIPANEHDWYTNMIDGYYKVRGNVELNGASTLYTGWH